MFPGPVGAAAAAQVGQGRKGDGRGGKGDDHARISYLDIPPAWDGQQPDSALEGFLKATEAWLRTTRVPPAQRGVQIMSQSSGDLREMLSTLELDEIVGADGGEKILEFIKKQYEYVLTRSLPKLFEEAVYGGAGQKHKNDSYMTYTARKINLFRKLHLAGCPLADLVQGMITLKHANLNKNEADAVFTWLSADYTMDSVVAGLRKLDRPQSTSGLSGPTI
eukprot:5224988-Amphidinium_carterae.1